MPVAPRVLVLGGAGFYGQYLVRDILANTSATVVVASRHPRHLNGNRMTTSRCDLRDFDSIARLARGMGVIVNCAGPFIEPCLNPVRAAIAAHAAYIDIAEGREHMRQVVDLASNRPGHDVLVLPGASVVPGLVALFAEHLGSALGDVRSVRAFAAPDLKRHRGPAMFATMLHGVGARFELPADGTMRTVHGWTEPEWVEFPPPVGRRLTYLVLEMADIDVLPRSCGAKTLEFKAGTEFPGVNRLLSVAARTRMRFGGPRWERYTWFVRGLSWLLGRFGRDQGGVIIEVVGGNDGNKRRRRLAVIAEHDGGRIPAVLGGIAVEETLAGRLGGPGVPPLDHWIGGEQLMTALLRRGLSIWTSGGDEPWVPIRQAAQPAGQGVIPL